MSKRANWTQCRNDRSLERNRDIANTTSGEVSNLIASGQRDLDTERIAFVLAYPHITENMRTVLTRAAAWIAAGHSIGRGSRGLFGAWAKSIGIATRTGKPWVFVERPYKRKVGWEKPARPAWMSDPGLLPKRPPLTLPVDEVR